MIRILRRLLLVLAAGGLALVAVGCSVSTNDEPVELSSDLFEDLLTTTTTTTTTMAPSDVTKDVSQYFLSTSENATELVEVVREADVDANTQEVLNDLFETPPDTEGEERPAEEGLSSAIPQSAALLSASLQPGTSVLVVDVQGLFGDEGIQGPELRNALAQIVWTATESDEVRSVLFRNEGEPAIAILGSGENSQDPVRKADYPRILG